MHLRSWLFLGLLLSLSCDALFGGFSQPNPKNCVRSPGLCSSGEFCDTVSERCTAIPAAPDFFAVQTAVHTLEAGQVLSGNFDGDGLPDVLMVAQGGGTVYYNVGTSLEAQREFKTKSSPSPFYALVSDLNGNKIDDLLIITETGTTDGMGGRYGTIEICDGRGSNMAEPFACNEPKELKFIPKAVALIDILAAPLPELVALTSTGEITVCGVVDLGGAQGACTPLQLTSGETVLYGQMLVIDDVSGDQKPDVAVLYGSNASSSLLKVVRSASGGTPTLSAAATVPLGFGELAAGYFRQNNQPCVAAVGPSAGSIQILEFCALDQPTLTSTRMVSTDAAELRGDPSTGRAVVSGQFDGVGSKPDDIAIQLLDNHTVFALGSQNGVGTPSSLAPARVPQPANVLLAAPFVRGAGGRSDLIFYNDPRESGGGRLGLMRSAGSTSTRGLMTQATQVRDNSNSAPNHLLLTGSFGDGGTRQLALVHSSPIDIALYNRDATGVPIKQSPAQPFTLADSLTAATTLPCGDAQDALVLAYKSQLRPSILHFRGGTTNQTSLANDGGISQLASADLNGDRLADLVALRSDGKLLAALATKSGCVLADFTTLATLPISNPTSPIFLAAGDAQANSAGGWG